MGIAELQAMKDNLDRQEAKTYGGASPRATKVNLLDATDVQEKYPDRRVRWIQVGNADRAAVRISVDGYQVLSDQEGGRRVGGLALAWIPRAVYEERVADVERKNKERLFAHEAEVEAVVDSIVRELRDKHGIRIDPKRILVKE